jgi:hypothetical protein
MERSKVYKIIDGERDYQDERWNKHTTKSGGKHDPDTWLVYIQHYLTKAIEVASTKPNPKAAEEVMEIIRKIGAMAVCAMEQNGVKER